MGSGISGCTSAPKERKRKPAKIPMQIVVGAVIKIQSKFRQIQARKRYIELLRLRKLQEDSDTDEGNSSDDEDDDMGEEGDDEGGQLLIPGSMKGGSSKRADKSPITFNRFIRRVQQSEAASNGSDIMRIGKSSFSTRLSNNLNMSQKLPPEEDPTTLFSKYSTILLPPKPVPIKPAASPGGIKASSKVVDKFLMSIKAGGGGGGSVRSNNNSTYTGGGVGGFGMAGSQEVGGGGASGNVEMVERNGIIIYPMVGFVVKSHHIHTNKKVFLNICHHECVATMVSTKAREIHERSTGGELIKTIPATTTATTTATAAGGGGGVGDGAIADSGNDAPFTASSSEPTVKVGDICLPSSEFEECFSFDEDEGLIPISAKVREEIARQAIKFWNLTNNDAVSDEFTLPKIRRGFFGDILPLMLDMKDITVEHVPLALKDSSAADSSDASGKFRLPFATEVRGWVDVAAVRSVDRRRKVTSTPLHMLAIVESSGGGGGGGQAQSPVQVKGSMRLHSPRQPQLLSTSSGNFSSSQVVTGSGGVSLTGSVAPSAGSTAASGSKFRPLPSGDAGGSSMVILEGDDEENSNSFVSMAVDDSDALSVGDISTGPGASDHGKGGNIYPSTNVSGSGDDDDGSAVSSSAGTIIKPSDGPTGSFIASAGTGASNPSSSSTGNAKSNSSRIVASSSNNNSSSAVNTTSSTTAVTGVKFTSGRLAPGVIETLSPRCFTRQIPLFGPAYSSELIRVGGGASAGAGGRGQLLQQLSAKGGGASGAGDTTNSATAAAASAESAIVRPAEAPSPVAAAGGASGGSSSSVRPHMPKHGAIRSHRSSAGHRNLTSPTSSSSTSATAAGHTSGSELAGNKSAVAGRDGGGDAGGLTEYAEATGNGDGGDIFDSILSSVSASTRGRGMSMRNGLEGAENEEDEDDDDVGFGDASSAAATRRKESKASNNNNPNAQTTMPIYVVLSKGVLYVYNRDPGRTGYYPATSAPYIALAANKPSGKHLASQKNSPSLAHGHWKRHNSSAGGGDAMAAAQNASASAVIQAASSRPLVEIARIMITEDCLSTSHVVRGSTTTFYLHIHGPIDTKAALEDPTNCQEALAPLYTRYNRICSSSSSSSNSSSSSAGGGGGVVGTDSSPSITLRMRSFSDLRTWKAHFRTHIQLGIRARHRIREYQLTTMLNGQNIAKSIPYKYGDLIAVNSKGVHHRVYSMIQQGMIKLFDEKAVGEIAGKTELKRINLSRASITMQDTSVIQQTQSARRKSVKEGSDQHQHTHDKFLTLLTKPPEGGAVSQKDEFVFQNHEINAKEYFEVLQRNRESAKISLYTYLLPVLEQQQRQLKSLYFASHANHRMHQLLTGGNKNNDDDGETGGGEPTTAFTAAFERPIDAAATEICTVKLTIKDVDPFDSDDEDDYEAEESALKHHTLLTVFYVSNPIPNESLQQFLDVFEKREAIIAEGAAAAADMNQEWDLDAFNADPQATAAAKAAEVKAEESAEEVAIRTAGDEIVNSLQKNLGRTPHFDLILVGETLFFFHSLRCYFSLNLWRCGNKTSFRASYAAEKTALTALKMKAEREKSEQSMFFIDTSSDEEDDDENEADEPIAAEAEDTFPTSGNPLRGKPPGGAGGGLGGMLGMSLKPSAGTGAGTGGVGAGSSRLDGNGSSLSTRPDSSASSSSTRSQQQTVPISGKNSVKSDNVSSQKFLLDAGGGGGIMSPMHNHNNSGPSIVSKLAVKTANLAAEASHLNSPRRRLPESKAPPNYPIHSWHIQLITHSNRCYTLKFSLEEEYRRWRELIFLQCGSGLGERAAAAYTEAGLQSRMMTTGGGMGAAGLLGRGPETLGNGGPGGGGAGGGAAGNLLLKSGVSGLLSAVGLKGARTLAIEKYVDPDATKRFTRLLKKDEKVLGTGLMLKFDPTPAKSGSSGISTSSSSSSSASSSNNARLKRLMVLTDNPRLLFLDQLGNIVRGNLEMSNDANVDIKTCSSSEFEIIQNNQCLKFASLEMPDKGSMYWTTRIKAALS